AVKEVAGACVSMGVTVDAKEPKEFIKNLDAGQYDAALKELESENGKMPLSKESITKALNDVRSKTPKRKFTQDIELSVKLREIDLKKPEGRINENLELPTAADKDYKVAVIAGGDLAVRARKGGADIVIGREDLDKLGREKKQARK